MGFVLMFYFVINNMEEQKTSKWFIILIVFLVALLLVCVFFDGYLSKAFFSWFNDDIATFENIYEDWSFSFDLEDFPDTLPVWEYTDLKISVLKDWEIFKDFSGYILFSLLDEEWNLVEFDDYVVAHYGYYWFLSEDQWVKVFENWLMIDKPWKYRFVIDAIDWFKNSFDIVVQ